MDSISSNEIPLHRLYNDLAWLWPLMSPPEEYVEEAAFWRQVLNETPGPASHSILELGVGGGHNLSHLTEDFSAAAVDISPAMLEHSKKLNPGVEHYLGDMRTVRLKRKFKAVLIHDAVSHLLVESDLRAVFATAAAHLEPGGLLIIAPDYFRENFRHPHVDTGCGSDGRVSLTYIEYTRDPDPEDTEIEVVFTYLIEQSGDLRIEHDRMLMGLFSKSTWQRLFREAGFHFREREFYLRSSNRPYVLLTGILK